MAVNLDEEKWDDSKEATEQFSSVYQFLPLESWLNDLNLSYIYNVLKDENIKTLDVLVQLDVTDLNELCDTIKTNLETTNIAFTSSDEELFTSEIIKKKNQYTNYLSNKEEYHKKMKQLNNRIKMYDDLINFSSTAINQSKLQKQTAIQSISEISNQIKMVITNLGEIAFEKYLKTNYNLKKHTDKSLLKLKTVKQKCQQALASDLIDDVIEETENNTQQFFEKSAEFLGKELIPSIVYGGLIDVNIPKICQQLISFGLIPFAQFMRCVGSLEEKEIDDDESSGNTSMVYLLILPHANGYIEDIKNEVKQRGIKILKDCGSISSENTTLLLMKQWLDLIDESYDELDEEQRIGYKPDEDENEEKKNQSQHDKEELKDDDFEMKQVYLPQDLDSDKEESKNDDFEIDQVYLPQDLDSDNIISIISIIAHYHFYKYFEEFSNKEGGTLYLIEIPKYSEEFLVDFFSNNFDIYCPAIIGEYASIYHPTTINGKFMSIYRQNVDQQRLNSMVNLGFIQVIDVDIAGEVLSMSD